MSVCAEYAPHHALKNTTYQKALSARGNDMSDNLIAVFIPSVHGGGAERAMLIFAEELLRLGFEVELVVGNLDGAWRDAIPQNLAVVDLKAPRMIGAILPLRRYIRRRKPKVMFSTISHANVGALIAAIFSGSSVPVVVRQSNTPLSERMGSLGNWCVGRLIPYLYPYAKTILAVSQSVRDELVAMNPKMAPRIKVVPTPVLSPSVYERAQVIPDHPWYQRKDKPIIVSVGRLKPHKGMFELIEAFSMLKNEVDARLVILGEGDDRSRLEGLIDKLGLKDDSALLGFMDNPFSFMKHADLFVLASHFEGLPNVLIQALALGLPVVATNSPGGVSELLADGKYGRLVPLHHVDMLAQSMLEELTEKESAALESVCLEQYDVHWATKQYVASVDI